MDSVSLFAMYKRLKRAKSSSRSFPRKQHAQLSLRRTRFTRRKAQERLFFAALMTMLVGGMFTSERLFWSKEKSSYWWEYIVCETFVHSDWIQNFRMSKRTFDYLCLELSPAIKKKDTPMRKAIGVQQRIAITLWYLASNSDFRTIAHLFGVSKASVCLLIKNVCAAIVDILLPKYISIPYGEELRNVIDGFSNSFGFPQCAGAVDGTHIPIISPVEFPADYYNRKGFHSILMQGTVNHMGRFMDINIGWPGRVHDARVFINSSLYKKGDAGTLFPDWKRTISGQDIPVVVLGDPAYPLLPWLLKAYPDNGNLTCQQKLFNYRLSKARVVVEHAYGRLKGRWRCLLTRNNTCLRDLPCLVAACCVLHNICEIRDDIFDEELMPETSQSNPASQSQNIVVSGKDIRSSLATYFSQS